MKELSFEEALKALEKITDDLEAGDISLGRGAEEEIIE